MMSYKELKLINLWDIVRFRGLELWSQLKKADMVSFIEENDKIDQTQCEEELKQGQRVELERRYHEELKRQRREKFEREHPKRDVIDRNSPEFKERLRKEEERRQRERDELREWCNLQEQLLKEERELKKYLMEAGFVGRYMSGQDKEFRD